MDAGVPSRCIQDFLGGLFQNCLQQGRHRSTELAERPASMQACINAGGSAPGPQSPHSKQHDSIMAMTAAATAWPARLDLSFAERAGRRRDQPSRRTVPQGRRHSASPLCFGGLSNRGRVLKRTGLSRLKDLELTEPAQVVVRTQLASKSVTGVAARLLDLGRYIPVSQETLT